MLARCQETLPSQFTMTQQPDTNNHQVTAAPAAAPTIYCLCPQSGITGASTVKCNLQDTTVPDQEHYTSSDSAYTKHNCGVLLRNISFKKLRSISLYHILIIPRWFGTQNVKSRVCLAVMSKYSIIPKSDQVQHLWNDSNLFAFFWNLAA